MAVSKLSQLRRNVFILLEPEAWPKAGLSPLNRLLVGLILLATLTGILETEPDLAETYRHPFRVVEIVIGTMFLIEYLARLWTAAENVALGSGWRARFLFVISPYALIDLLVIASALLPLLALNVFMLRLVRLIRIARVIKLGRTSKAVQHIRDALKSCSYELLVTLGLAVILLIFGASALYWVEGDVQPDKFGSIPRALWWAVVTLTTIGYGDVYPVTPMGKIIAAAVALIGVALIALPAGIFAAAFSAEIKNSAGQSEDDRAG